MLFLSILRCTAVIGIFDWYHQLSSWTLVKDIFDILFQKTIITLQKKWHLKSFLKRYVDVPRESVMILNWNYHQYQKALEFKSPVSNRQLNSQQIINKNESTTRFHKLISFFESDVLTWWGSVFDSYSNLELLSIGKVVYYESSQQLILRPKTNRFCCNIKRQHKRNGIYFVINIAEFNFTQKCHDHNCAGYRSESFPLDPALFFLTF